MSDALDHLDGEESALGAEEMSKFREADLYLPINNIVRVMKEAIPPNVKIGKDSKDTVKYCVSEFISFITSQAADHCLEHNRKTISGDDILEALATLGLDLYLEPLQEYLRMYREAVHADSDSDSFSSGDGQSSKLLVCAGTLDSCLSSKLCGSYVTFAANG
jgi:nuclear transcription Y subunit beta